jgi:hypothetical protein
MCGSFSSTSLPQKMTSRVSITVRVPVKNWLVLELWRTSTGNSSFSERSRPNLLTYLSASHNAPVKSGGNEALPLQEQEQTVQRWSILWRTVLLSCTEETLFPYCHYLRVLDLRDLYNLLDDDKFRGRIYQ